MYNKIFNNIQYFYSYAMLILDIQEKTALLFKDSTFSLFITSIVSFQIFRVAPGLNILICEFGGLETIFRDSWRPCTRPLLHYASRPSLHIFTLIQY